MAERLCKTVAELEEMPMSELTEWKGLYLLRAAEREEEARLAEEQQRDAFVQRAVKETQS